MSPHNILAIETTTDSCSVGLLFGNQTLLRYENAPREHTRLLLPMINSILKEAGITLADLNALAATIGPGSFTGVRIGTAMMQALSFASRKPVVPVSTLRAMAQEAYSQDKKVEKVFVRLEAGKNEIYAACFCLTEAGIMSAFTEESVMDIHNLVLPEGNWITVQNPPTAESVLKLAVDEYERGAAVSAEQVQPVYLSAGHFNPS